MNGKTRLVIVTGVLAVSAGIFWTGYLKGWYAYSEQVNSQAKERLIKQEKGVAACEQKAATANAEAKVIYRTVYRDVVKYVNDPIIPSASLILLLCNCASVQLTRPTISPDLMNPPCRLSNAGADSDADLLADTQSA